MTLVSPASVRAGVNWNVRSEAAQCRRLARAGADHVPEKQERHDNDPERQVCCTVSIVASTSLERRADQILLPAALDVARADVGIVLSERIEHLAEGQTGGALHISHPMARLGD
jgi:hypothetical protein